jgi:hypothetical protein
MVTLKDGPKRDAIRKLQGCELSPLLFLQWLDALRQRLRYGEISTENVRHKYGDWCQQYSEECKVNGRHFRLIWDLDLNDETGEYTLMEFGCVEIHPRVQ